MKTIFFRKKDNGVSLFQPFGIRGCLWRFIVFIALLAVLILLLSLFHRCSIEETIIDVTTEIQPIGGGTNVNDSIVHNDGRDNNDGDAADWNRPIDDGEEIGLPAPGANRLPPFDDLPAPIPNPNDGGATEIYPNLLYVIFDSDGSDDVFRTFAQKFYSLYSKGAHEIIYYNTGSKTAVLRVPENERDNICERLPKQITEVKFYIVPVEVMEQNVITTETTSTDVLPWHYEPIGAPAAWNKTKGSADVIVGIVDSYMDLSHPALGRDRCLYPYSIPKGNDDVSPDTNIPAEYAGHGTLVTSIAVGAQTNSTSGIAPQCRYIPVSIGMDLNTITEVEGLLYCMYHGATVINLSCGAMFTDVATTMSLQDQIAYAKQHGKAQENMWNYVFSLCEKRNVTIVWATGNDNCYVAMDTSKRDANTIRVSAVDRNLHKAEFSNFGNFPQWRLADATISAPGVDIYGALPNSKYGAWSGTSFAAPIITGVVALLKSRNHDLTTKQIIDVLQETSKPVYGAPEIGGLVQIPAAIEAAQEVVAAGQVKRNGANP